MTTTTKSTTQPTTRTEVRASQVAAHHNHATCPGCDQVLHMGDLAVILGESVHTLYKWSAIGWPVFPRRLHLRNSRVATTCRLTKAWMLEVAS